MLTLTRRHLLAGVRDARRERPLNAAHGDATSMALAYALSAHMTSPSRAVARLRDVLAAQGLDTVFPKRS